MLLVLLAVALLISSIGFRQYVWFFSIGYGFSVMGIGVTLLVVYGSHMTVLSLLTSVLLIVYGVRLGGYLLLREIKSDNYHRKINPELKTGQEISFWAKCAIWIPVSLLYLCQTCPLVFRQWSSGGEDDVLFLIGTCISVVGLLIEALADHQKTVAKRRNPQRFVDTGLYRLVRCPNYFGELLFWTGIFAGGIGIYQGAGQWLLAILGYLGIVYVMFSGARRLERRQNRTYGHDAAYRAYHDKTPILLPFLPLYSVLSWRWFVA